MLVDSHGQAISGNTLCSAFALAAQVSDMCSRRRIVSSAVYPACFDVQDICRETDNGDTGRKRILVCGVWNVSIMLLQWCRRDDGHRHGVGNWLDFLLCYDILAP